MKFKLTDLHYCESNLNNKFALLGSFFYFFLNSNGIESSVREKLIDTV